MSQTHTPAFVGALDELGVEHSRAAPADCADAVAAAVEGEAVGVPLGDDLALPEAVETAPTNGDLEAADTGVTPAGFAVAETGSVHLPSDAAGVEPVSLYPFRHVAVVRESTVLPDVPAAIERYGDFLRNGGSGVLATGPSATADMGELVVGAHGPGEVHVVIVEDADESDESDEGDGDAGGNTTAATRPEADDE
ncbi:LutC/YkgG family protein [Haloparvum sedimenti]|uniref:LutC/YkgG family protein n=1 Tax=Haloparvum sedimenti TaxID=1678448 RepID=UPI00071E76C5|nr:LUD domain-containing protein [Haloparvum sedimenti]